MAPGTMRSLLMTRRAVACRGKLHACSGRTLCTGGPSLKDVRVRLLPRPHKLPQSEREGSEDEARELLCTNSLSCYSITFATLLGRLCLSIRSLVRQGRLAPTYSRSLSMYRRARSDAPGRARCVLTQLFVKETLINIQVKETYYTSTRDLICKLKRHIIQVCAEPNGSDAPRRAAYGAVQLPVRPPPRGHLSPAHRRY